MEEALDPFNRTITNELRFPEFIFIERKVTEFANAAVPSPEIWRIKDLGSGRREDKERSTL